MHTINAAEVINATATALATEVHQDASMAHRDIQAITPAHPRLALALELHKNLLDNLAALLKASREMTVEDSAAWIIKIDGVSLLLVDGHTHPASADTATRLAPAVAQEMAGKFHNQGGVPGVAMPYLSGLNDDILRCAKALHECSLVVQVVALEVPQGNA